MHDSITVDTSARLDTIDVTDRIAAVVPGDVDAGTCSVFVKHTTAAVIVNESEPRLRRDTEEFLSALVPDEGHAHDEIDDNADAHLRATILGPDVTVPVRDGELALGTWGSILLIDCDGPRSRTLEVTVTPSP